MSWVQGTEDECREGQGDRDEGRIRGGRESEREQGASDTEVE